MRVVFLFFFFFFFLRIHTRVGRGKIRICDFLFVRRDSQPIELPLGNSFFSIYYIKIVCIIFYVKNTCFLNKISFNSVLTIKKNMYLSHVKNTWHFYRIN
jgi:hypothetical protein